MTGFFEKLILLTLIYGGIILMSGKGASGNILRFSCAVGMLVFLSGSGDAVVRFENMMFYDMASVQESADEGEKMFENSLHEQLKARLESEIQSICNRYGARGDVSVNLKIENRDVEIESIELSGDFESLNGLGFIKNEIKNTYNVDEVKIVEK